MNFYIGISASIAAIVLGGIVTLLVMRVKRRRENDLRFAQIETWCQQVEVATTDAEIADLDSPNGRFYYRNFDFVHWTDFEETDRMRRAKLRWEAATHRRKVSRLQANVANAPYPANKAELLMKEYDSEVAAEVLGVGTERFKEVIAEMVLEDLAAAQAGDVPAMVRFMNFHDNYHQRFPEDLASAMSFPEDWNELVVNLIEAPLLGYFRHLNKNPQKGEVGLIAAEALRTQSLMLGKLTLAFCAQEQSRGKGRPFFPYREEIGDVLLADVTKMVERIHAERKLFTRS